MPTINGGAQILIEWYTAYNYEIPQTRKIRKYTSTGQILSYEYYERVDGHDDLFQGIYYYTCQRDNSGKLLSTTDYRWDEINNEWLKDYTLTCTYTNTTSIVRDKYEHEVNGYVSIWGKNNVVKLSYDATTGRYTAADEPEWGQWQITYNELLMVDEIICLTNNGEDEKVKCYYNTAGRDANSFYRFLGVPNSTFYLNVKLEGYEQSSTHEIHITDFTTIFEGKNFTISDGTIATGMDEEPDNSTHIYPNPTTGQQTIKSDSPVQSIVIYNISGAKLIEFSHTNSINLSHFQAGIYLIEIQTTIT